MKINVSVYRYDSKLDQKGHYDNFELGYSPGMTVLDIIFYIQKHLDPTLAYRYECRQGICGTCGLMLNGKPVLSCSTQIDPSKPIKLDPLANFPVEKDLIANIKPILDRFYKVKPFIEQAGDVTITKEVAQKSKPFRKCIECGCCIAGTLFEGKKENTLDPMDLVKIARYVTDPRDTIDRSEIIKKSGVEEYSEKEAIELSKICPRNIPIDEAVRILKAETAKSK